MNKDAGRPFSNVANGTNQLKIKESCHSAPTADHFNNKELSNSAFAIKLTRSPIPENIYNNQKDTFQKQ
ncbi:hypothetical protein [Virgibacillus pantothenticus]|uniref:hypothetical protein n=1 Tax=Virgibacillus pantothenticus TaxID=1473 RepID=UPI001BAF3A43|nr:hypothetical protein [Virgibacillus pantothenticus]